MNLNHYAFSTLPEDRLVVIKEQHLAEASFIFSHLLQHTLNNQDNRIICILTHNSIGHLMSVGLRLNSNFVNNFKAGLIKVIDAQELIVSSIENPQIDVCNEIQKSLKQLVHDSFLSQINKKGKICIFIDDFTSFLDYTHDLSKCINFLNNLLGLHYNVANVMYIIGLHMGNVNDQILSCDLENSADCIIDISVMRTGRSADVDGIMKIVRDGRLSKYHYKVKDYWVDLAMPGKFLIN